MFKEITSLQNPIIKRILLLKDKAKQRNIEGVFIIEGQRELALAIKGGYVLKSLFFEPNLFNESQIDAYKTNGTEVTQITSNVYNKIAYRGSTEGIVAIAESKSHTLEDLKLGSNPLILVAEAPEKPGNIGALLRTADAAGMDGLIIANPKTELYNPNTIRSSLGSLFSMQIATDSTENVINFLTKNDIQICSTYVEKSKNYLDINYSKPSAIVMGKESSSLTSVWRNKSDELISIPMKGKMDSLNLSVCAAIVIFEGLKQRDDN